MEISKQNQSPYIDQGKLKEIENLNKRIDKIYIKLDDSMSGHEFQREKILKSFRPITKFIEENKEFLENNSNNVKIKEFNETLRDVRDKIHSLYFNQ